MSQANAPLSAARLLCDRWPDLSLACSASRRAPPNARVLSCAGSLNVLGYRVRRDDFTALGRVHRRMRRRLAATLDGREGPDQRRSIAASAGVVLF